MSVTVTLKNQRIEPTKNQQSEYRIDKVNTVLIRRGGSREVQPEKVTMKQLILTFDNLSTGNTADTLRETFTNELMRPNYVPKVVSSNDNQLVGHPNQSPLKHDISKKDHRRDDRDDLERLLTSLGHFFPFTHVMTSLFSGSSLKSSKEKSNQLAITNEQKPKPRERPAAEFRTERARPCGKSNKMTYYPHFRLGVGSYNTVVFKGRLGQRPVAVKRLVITSRSDHTRVIKELRILTQCDYHENIVRLYHYETETTNLEMDLVYIALELCNQTLDQWVQSANGRSVYDDISLCNQMASGIRHLHDQGIIHRDIKPSNILLLFKDREIKLKIADFGISREIPQDITHITLHSFSGTATWMAPEILVGNLRLSRKSDIFSLGCVFYYLLTNGKQLQIGGKIELNWEALDPSAIGFVSLILMMTKTDPYERPSASAVHSYHTFWTEITARNFLVAVSNALDQVSPGSRMEICSRRLDRYSFRRPAPSTSLVEFGVKNSENSCWADELCSILQMHIYRKNKYRSYDTNNPCHLLRCLRNLDQHFTTQPVQVREAFGGHRDFTNYWLSRFPLLVDIVFLAFQDAGTKRDDALSSFYLNVNEYKPWPDVYSMLNV